MKCKQRYCAICSNLAKKEQQKKLSTIIQQYLQENKYLILLTLRIGDRENLENSINIIKEAWRYFTRKDRRCANEFEHRYIGGIKTTEITLTKSKHWITQLNCILIADRYAYDELYLKTAWNRCINLAGGLDNEGNITYKQIHLIDRTYDLSYTSTELNDHILKMTTNISNFNYPLEQSKYLNNLHSVLKDMRLTDTFGCCRNI